MTEVLFILVTLYVVYVVHSSTTSKKEKKSGKEVLEKPVSEAKKNLKKESNVEVKKEKTVPKKKAAKKTVSKKENIGDMQMPTGTMRNPETGEEVNIANSYRMLRRWIKEALVKEGLVDKIYKTSELDAGTVKKINKAMNKLKKMDEYQ
ncbi:MAG: hypothetical protein KAH20_03165 [Methylococcales bacterium]|nr:hypothetical protein [Methylococcales bacterium]